MQLRMLSDSDRDKIERIKSLCAELNSVRAKEIHIEKAIYSEFSSLPEEAWLQVFYNNFGYKSQVEVLRSIANQIERSNQK